MVKHLPIILTLDTEFDANTQMSLEEIQSCYVKRALSNCQVRIVLS